MSDPAVLLQSLHIEEMPVTRSQAQLRSQSDGRNSRASLGRGGASLPSPNHSAQATPVQSYTGRQYYTQPLTPMSARRAIEGLEANFSVDRVQDYDSGREKYYAFQLRTPVAVRIYEPSRGQARIECSCEAHRVSKLECAHIYVR